ncbi:MAG: UbiA family prenyltransferase [Oligoflexia bacterium]|nr:UbiA family prenyltransferase [Oligoflexia bacterium]
MNAMSVFPTIPQTTSVTSVTDAITPRTVDEIFVVDLDNTLIKTDLSIEGILKCIKANPFEIFNIIKILLKDPKHLQTLKIYLANNKNVEFNYPHLPYRQSILKLIEKQRKENPNVPVVLASGSPKKWVEGVAKYLNLFDMVLATSADVNLIGKNKLKLINKHFPHSQFSYVGDSLTDIHLWKESKKAIVVNPGPFIQRKLSNLSPDLSVKFIFDFDSCVNNNWTLSKLKFTLKLKLKLKEIIKLIRVHQWSKNLLLFVPMILAHSFTDSTKWIAAFMAFFIFSLSSSCVYVINDLLDIDSDRHRVDRRSRPFASGNLPIIWFFPIIICLSALILFLLPKTNITFANTLLIYLLLTFAYSLKLKRYLILDVVLLSSFYTLRLYAGGEATSTSVSEWFLTFSIFFFFGLSMLKRFIEVKFTAEEIVAGRGYHQQDQIILLISGVVSSFLSIVVITLYIHNKTVLAMYKHPGYLWFWVILFLYWTNRIWLLGNRGVIKSDPVAWVLKDKLSWVIICLILIILILAL